MNLYAFWNEFDQQLYSYPRKLKICHNLCTKPMGSWYRYSTWLVHGTVANLWGRHKDFTEFNENFEKSYLLNGLSNIVKIFTIWFLKIFCIKWIHIFFWVQCSFNHSTQSLGNRQSILQPILIQVRGNQILVKTKVGNSLDSGFPFVWLRQGKTIITTN